MSVSELWGVWYDTFSFGFRLEKECSWCSWQACPKKTTPCCTYLNYWCPTASVFTQQPHSCCSTSHSESWRVKTWTWCSWKHSKKHRLWSWLRGYSWISIQRRWDFGWMGLSPLPPWLLPMAPIVGAFEVSGARKLFLRGNHRNLRLGSPPPVGCFALRFAVSRNAFLYVGVFVSAWLFTVINPLLLGPSAGSWLSSPATTDEVM